MNEITVSTALDALRTKQIPFLYRGAEDVLIARPASIEALQEGDIAFLRSGSLGPYRRSLNSRNVAIISRELSDADFGDANLIFVESPEIAFYAVARLFVAAPVPGIHPSAVVSPHAKIGTNVFVGALTYIGPQVTIGDDSVIGEGCVIDNTSIGNGTVVQAGVKLGSEALGALKDSAGRWHDRSHFGRVMIGSNVRIEDNVVINRGYFKDTVVSDNVRIGPLTAIGNAVRLEEGVLLAQMVTIAGSVSIGKHSSVWGNASIRESVSIGSGSVVGMGSVLLQDMPDCQLWVGNPASFKRQLDRKDYGKSGVA